MYAENYEQLLNQLEREQEVRANVFFYLVELFKEAREHEEEATRRLKEARTEITRLTEVNKGLKIQLGLRGGKP